MLCTVILLSVLTASVLGQCPSYKPIPDIHRRDTNYELESGESPINDREIIEGWYGTPGYILVSAAPGFFKCGGWYPIWRRETNGGRAVLCIETATDKCSDDEDLEINVATCDGTEIYELKEAPLHRASYCFEKSENAPDVQIVSSVKVDQTHAIDKSSYVFRCEFEKPDVSLFYKTFWYVNGELKHDFDAMQWGDSVDYIVENALTEEILSKKGITKAGFNLQCTVRAQTTETGRLSQGDLSENLFVGVKVEAWTSYRLAEGESRDINLTVDIPFGCGRFLQNRNEECLMNVEVITTQDKETCAEAAVVQKSCGIEDLKKGQKSTVTVTGKVTSTYDVSSAVSHLKLKTSKDLSLSSLWNDYEIGSFPIQIIKSTTATQFKICMSKNDPYVWTFDGLDFDLEEGVFLLYEDAVGIEVQIETEKCVKPIGRGPFCTCGVAVRAGRTVFEISHCESPVWHIGFSACEDTGEVMNVVRSGFNYYVIHLPSGLRVDIKVSVGEPHYVNVFVHPTVKDVGKSRGMCGTLSSTADKSRTAINERIEQSRVIPVTKSLFNPGITLSSYKPLYQYCTCITENSKKSLECSPMTATEVCINPEYQTTVTPKECVISKRKKRMAQFSERNKRSVETEATSWNESLARDYCNKEFEKSNTVQLVKDVPGINVDDSIQNCVDDILKSRTTDFTRMAIDSIRVLAMVQAMKNLNLSMPMQDDPQRRSMFKLITEHTCQGDCSGKGMCIKGVCQCNAGFGGGDCSVDLSVPPVLYDVGGSLCDLSGANCSKTAVIGNIFSGEKEAKCRIEKQKISPNGEVQTASVHLMPAVAESISEVECQLPEADDDDVAIAYHISVSQSAETAPNRVSNMLSILVYDSSCVTLNQESYVWDKKNDKCTYKGKCLNTGDLREDNPCLICENIGGVARWTLKAGCETTGSTSNTSDTTLRADETENNQLPLIIGAAVGSVVLVILATIAIAAICIKDRIKRQSGSAKEQPSQMIGLDNKGATRY